MFTSQVIAQTIDRSTPQRLQVPQLVAQVVESGISKRLMIAQLAVQTLISDPSNSGGVFRVASDAAQVVYSIGAPDTPRQKAWTFDFDGHTFYVLDLAEQGAMVYDLTTQSWSKWDTAGYEGHFNFKNGFHWRDGKQVIGGGLLQGLLVGMDEGSYLDEDFRPVGYEVNGVVFSSTEKYMRQFNLRLVGSSGRTGLLDEEDPPTLNMTYSDDNGATWSPARSVTLTQDKSQRIEFRSLGALRQPGRIFRLYDNGGIKFLAYVVADIEGAE